MIRMKQQCYGQCKTSKKIIFHVKMMYSYLSGEVSAFVEIDTDITSVLDNITRFLLINQVLLNTKSMVEAYDEETFVEIIN